jgi:transaldolase
MTKLHDLAQLGQAIWLDDIRRAYLTDGELAAWVEKGLRGLTSNPTIFEKAINGSADYDAEMSALGRSGKSTQEIYEALAMDDIRRAADVLRPVYEQTGGADGFVSLEVSPTLAQDTAGTAAEAKRLFAAVGRPNLMIKIPATPEGLPAIQSTLARGINVNVTLIFSVAQYEAVMQAYLAGLEAWAAAGGSPQRVASVASFFVSRVDTAVDRELQAIVAAGGSHHAELARSLLGKIAIANSKVAYARFQEIFGGERWKKLAMQGACGQRPLWASTGTKNPAYPDTLYVDELIGPHTVNTLPPATLQAVMDHGRVACTLDEEMELAYEQLERLAGLGIDLEIITRHLLDEGVSSFAKSFETLMASIERKREHMLEVLNR